MTAEIMERTREEAAAAERTRDDLTRAIDELLRVIAQLNDAEERLRRYEPLATLLVEAIADRDIATLEWAAPTLRRLEGERAAGAESERVADAEERGRLATLLSFVGAALDHLAPTVAATRVEPGSRRHRFLRAVDAKPGLSSNELAKLLDLEAPSVSRVGHEALNAGLVAQRKLGRVAEWRLTPRGQQVLEEVGGREPPMDVPEDVLTASADAAHKLIAQLAAEPEPAEERVLAAFRSSVEPLELDASEREQAVPHVFALALRHLADIGRGLVYAHGQVEPDVSVGELLIEAKGMPEFDLLRLASPSGGAIVGGLNGRSYVVAPDEPGGWVILQPSRELARKKEAIVCARQLAKENGARMVVLDTKGRIRESKDYPPAVKLKGRTRTKSSR